MKKRFALALAAALCLTMLASTAQAADTTLDITYVPITEDGFVADTMDGVDAVYNRSGGPDCADLVARYYAAVYGVTVQLGSAPIVVSGEGRFEEVDVPQRGDVLYASAEVRGSGTHYALCKSVDTAAGTVTLFEQNWVWNGQAGIDRVIPLESCYTYYTLPSRLPMTGTSPPRAEAGMRPTCLTSRASERPPAGRRTMYSRRRGLAFCTALRAAIRRPSRAANLRRWWSMRRRRSPARMPDAEASASRRSRSG